MFCQNCGAKLEKGDTRCPSCLKPNGENAHEGVERVGAGGIGYSHLIDHPSFEKFRSKNKKVGMILAPIVAAVIALLLIVVGVHPLLALFVGVILLIPIFLAALLSTRKKKSWEGTVEKKVYSESTGPDDYAVWKIKFKTDDGKRKVYKWRTPSGLYQYLQEGDRVRFIGEIGGLYAFEKYDKSNDSDIPCAGCGSLQDPRNTYCAVCGCILLKGNPTVR